MSETSKELTQLEKLEVLDRAVKMLDTYLDAVQRALDGKYIKNFTITKSSNENSNFCELSATVVIRHRFFLTRTYEYHSMFFEHRHGDLAIATFNWANSVIETTQRILRRLM